MRRDRWKLFLMLGALIGVLLYLGWNVGSQFLSIVTDAMIASVAIVSLYVAWNQLRIREAHGIRCTWEDTPGKAGGEGRRILVTNTGKHVVTVISGVIQKIDDGDEGRLRFQTDLRGTQTPIPSGETREVFEVSTSTRFHAFGLRTITYIDSEGTEHPHNPDHLWYYSTPSRVRADATAVKTLRHLWEKFKQSPSSTFFDVSPEDLHEKTAEEIISENTTEMTVKL